MPPPIKLFERRRRCLGSCLRQNEQITAISGFGSTIVVGTNQGSLIVFTPSSALWEEGSRLQLSEKRNCAIEQICCASALGLFLVIFGEELIAILNGDELMIETLQKGVKRIALNSYPSTDDPFSIQLSIAHSQKQLILIGRLSDNISQFRKEHKITTNGKVVEHAYSGNFLCYAIEMGAYFVQNLHDKNALRLFQSSNGDIPYAICPLGNEEFLLTGIQSLLMFVNGQGASTRPPISLPGDNPAIGMTLKEPFLYVLDNSGMLFIFSTMDGQLKQCLDFPIDDEQGQQQNFPFHYQLANIDGQIIVLPPTDGCLFELVSMDVFTQIEDLIQMGELNTALSMMEENLAQIPCISTGKQEINRMHSLQQKIAFILLQRGDFDAGIDLLLKSETSPRRLLSIVIRQNGSIGLNEDFIDIPSDLPLDINKFPQIALDKVKYYLETVYTEHGKKTAGQEAEKDIELVECILARIYSILGEFSYVEHLTDPGKWNCKQFRQWLSLEQKQPNKAAKLAIDGEQFEEAFVYWRGIAENIVELEGKKIALVDCFQALQKLKSPILLQAEVSWLIPIDAQTCMIAIENMDAVATEPSSGQQTIPPEFVIQHYEKTNPEILFSYLDKRIHFLNTPILHNKMLQLFIQNVNLEKSRQKFHHFLLFSNYYEKQLAQQKFDENPELFQIERILITATNESNAIQCLRQLMENIEEMAEQERMERSSIAEQLCVRYASPELVKAMLNIHLRLSRTNPALRQQIPRILALLDNKVEAKEVLSNLPEDLDCSALIQNFLGRHFSTRLGKWKWQNVQQKMANRQENQLKEQLMERRGRTNFRMDANSTCDICERTLMGGTEEFIMDPKNNKLAHLRCHQIREQKRIWC